MRAFDKGIAVDKCAKCGFQHFWPEAARSPRFQQQTVAGGGFLEWPCRNCQHVVRTDTADAKELA